MAHKHTRSQREVLDALADVISVDPNSSATSQNASRTGQAPPTSSASFSGRAPMSNVESQPAVPTKDDFDPLGPSSQANANAAPPPVSKSGGFGRLANAFKRQNADEKDAKRRDRERRMQRAMTDSASRMDVIDRMDLSGLGASLFHHDSPYDACSPHSNRNARKAPVQAFDATIDPMTGLPFANAAQRNGSGSGHGRPGLSPLAAATMRKMNDSAGDVPDDGKGGHLLSGSGRSRSHPTNQMPTLGRNMTSSTANSGFQSTSELESIDAGSSVSVNSNIDQGYMTQPSNVSRGRSDVSNPNADIWGMTSEPWQDFAQPSSRLEPPSRGSLEGGGSAASSVLDMEAVLTGKTTNKAVGASMLGVNDNGMSPSLSNSSSDGPKRSKSLIKRIKNARQYGNVPPPDEDIVDHAEAKAAAEGGRATAAGLRRPMKPAHRYSPSTPPLMSTGGPGFNNSGMTRSETAQAGPNAFNGQGNGQASGNATGANLGRNGSIFNRFRGGNKSRERDVAVAR